MSKPIFVFDVESIGLFGESFAVGGVCADWDGKVHFEFLHACRQASAIGDDEDRKWVGNNVPAFNSDLIRHNPRWVREAFWVEYLKAKEIGAIMFAECSWPVEAKFLIECIQDDIDSNKWQGPYPFHDIASIMLAAGKSPLGTHPRLPGELPAHNPLCDARQSLRLLLECQALLPNFVTD